MNGLLDMLNSKSKFVKRIKQAIDSKNFIDIENSYCEAFSFLKSLKDSNDVPLIQGPRKTFVIGFCVSANSVFAICRYILDRQESPFE